MALGYLAASALADHLLQKVLAEHGVTDLTQVVEYQGVGGGILQPAPAATS